MAKMDTRGSLPSCFHDMGVFVLPTSNGEYVIVRGEGYHDLEPIESSIQTFPSVVPFELVSPGVGQSEMQYIDQAYNAGLLEHFADVEGLYLSVRGRKYSPAFKFRVDRSPVIETKGVQVEIDGGFEGEDEFIPLEAKIGPARDFIIRQLYYPFRFWREGFGARGSAKTVRPMFFVYDPQGQVYNFWEYQFLEATDYASIAPVKSGRFRLAWKPLAVGPFRDVSPDEGGSRRRIVPQADDVAKIGEIPFLILRGIETASELAKHFRFDKRQSSYYTQAAEALGLIELRGSHYHLTGLGSDYARKSAPARNEMLCKLMLQLPIFNEALAMMLVAPGQSLTNDHIKELIHKRGYSGTTPGRRARTILSWFEWMERSFGLVEVRRGSVSLRRRQRQIDETPA